MGPYCSVLIAQAGWWNIPNLSQWEVFTILMCHPVLVPLRLIHPNRATAIEPLRHTLQYRAQNPYLKARTTLDELFII